MSFKDYLNEGTFIIYTKDDKGKAGPRIKVKAIDKANAEFQAKKIVGVKQYSDYAVDKIEEFKEQIAEAKPNDMMGSVCKKCKKGKYEETSTQDDVDGVLHCNRCNNKVDRYSELKESKDTYVDLKASQDAMLELENELGDDYWSISWEGFVAVIKPEIKNKFLTALKKLKLKHEVLK